MTTRSLKAKILIPAIQHQILPKKTIQVTTNTPPRNDCSSWWMDTRLSPMELFVGICIIPFLSALFIQAGQDENSEDHDFL